MIHRYDGTDRGYVRIKMSITSHALIKNPIGSQGLGLLDTPVYRILSSVRELYRRSLCD